MDNQQDNIDPYASVRDLPFVVEMTEHLEGLRLLSGIAGHELKPELDRLKKDLDRIVSTVDGFYEVLGPRNWIFHESLDLELGELISGQQSDEAERLLIARYKDPDHLRSMVRKVRNHPSMRPRLDQIEKARIDFESERYYSTVLLLLAVMDGFVNDMDPDRRRGLHARGADEMVAWNSVVGHHLGLSNAHQTFSKGFYKTSGEEVYELYRNGIMHGTLTNFDNEIVASKAWNRLFAIGDWAKSVERAKEPVEPEPTWQELRDQLKENEQFRTESEAWRPKRLRKDDDGFTDHPMASAAEQFLAAWKTQNYGAMARLLARNSLSYDQSIGKAAGNVRSEYELMPLDEFEVLEFDFQAAAICEIEALLTCDGNAKPAWLRWIREDGDGAPVIDDADGSWKVMSWGPWAFFNRRESEGEDGELDEPSAADPD